MTEVDRTLHVLPAAENDRIFREEIVPDTLVGTPQEQPVAIIVSGQTGAGKTSITTLATQALADRGAHVNINLDTYKPYHPKFDALMRADDTTAGAYTSIDGHKWMEAAEAYAIDQRFDIVLESAMRDPRDFEEPAARLRAAGYRVEVPVVAVHESMSRLGALDRYLKQVEAFGQGRMIDQGIHDACYAGVVRATASIDDDRLASSVFVVRRDASVVYSNHLDSADQWTRTPGTPQAVTGERDRPWTERESLLFAATTAQTHKRIEQLPPQDRAAPLRELGAIAELARPLVHPAADIAVHRALGPLWSSAPKLPAVHSSAARSRSTTVTRGPAEPQRHHATPPRAGGPGADQQRRQRSR
ncbi:zeta toxin family protein [Streptomyces ipomoeae]|uniref:zeta toxin family protein n=1 Tax=Streptomyces ipomoeae TaxID=103232 RepID=UPI0029BCBD35|nr:zeta toxin family protein [Streptomyces ipomoeae]MDX2692189.1 zeta toxin family protein [Streptomyces ipomoeae]MDX2839296.1 zeta toxin family protein [Streptomyces ipomoeae]